LIKSDSKDIYNDAFNLLFQINAVVLNFLFIKRKMYLENVSRFPQNINFFQH